MSPLDTYKRKIIIWDKPYPVKIFGTTETIYSYEEFETIFSANENNKDIDGVVIVLAELKWKEHKRTDFYGLELIQELRRRNYNLPAVICSFNTRKDLLKRNYNILSFRSHGFVQLPDLNGLDSSSLTPLSRLEMIDLKFHFCSIGGMIDAIFHKKQTYNEKDPDDAKKGLLSIFESMESINGLPNDFLDKLNQYKNKIYALKTKDEVNLFLNESVDPLKTYFEEEQSDNIIHQEGRWEILILDDEIHSSDDLKLLCDELIKRGVAVIHKAETYIQAEEIINNDHFNLISAVICDYRLIEKDEMKGYQGYEFVSWLAKQNRHNALFIYSGLSRQFLKRTFREYGYNVYIESKYGALKNKRSGFADTVIEKGNEEYDRICSIPSTGQWKNMNYLYKHLRQKEDYNNIDDRIGKKANSIINEYLVSSNLISRISDSMYAKTFRYTEKLTCLPELTKALYDEANNKPHSLTNEKQEKQLLSALENVLIGRRVALYLMAIKNIKKREYVYSVLVQGKTEYDLNVLKSYEDRTKGLFDHLSLSIADYPHNILVEERRWLNLYWNANIDLSVAVERESQVFLEKTYILTSGYLFENSAKFKGKELNYIQTVPRTINRHYAELNFGFEEINLKNIVSSILEIHDICYNEEEWNSYFYKILEHLFDLVKKNIFISDVKDFKSIILAHEKNRINCYLKLNNIPVFNSDYFLLKDEANQSYLELLECDNKMDFSYLLEALSELVKVVGKNDDLIAFISPLRPRFKLYTKLGII